MKLSDIKIIEKKVKDLDENDDYVFICGTIMRFIRCGHTRIHSHPCWLFKRITIEGYMEIYIARDGNQNIFNIKWKK